MNLLTTPFYIDSGQDWEGEYKAMKSVDGVEEIGDDANTTATTNTTTNTTTDATTDTANTTMSPPMPVNALLQRETYRW